MTAWKETGIVAGCGCVVLKALRPPCRGVGDHTGRHAPKARAAAVADARVGWRVPATTHNGSNPYSAKGPAPPLESGTCVYYKWNDPCASWRADAGGL